MFEMMLNTDWLKVNSVFLSRVGVDALFVLGAAFGVFQLSRHCDGCYGVELPNATFLSNYEEKGVKSSFDSAEKVDTYLYLAGMS